MGSKLKFIVEVEFTEEIRGNKLVIEVAENIADAIKREADNGFIAPDNSDTVTKVVTVKPEHLNKTITVNIF